MATIQRGGAHAPPERELVLVRCAEASDDWLEGIRDPEALDVIGAGIMTSRGTRPGMDLLGLRHVHETARPQIPFAVDGIEPHVPLSLRGRADPPLSDRGARQAAELAAWFDERPPAAVVTSPRRRAVESATAIVRRHRVPTSIDARLDDVDCGAWTGHEEATVREVWPALYQLYRRGSATFAFPNGEALVAAQTRAVQLVAELAAIDRADRIAIITHDAILRLLVSRILRVPLAGIHQMRFANASITVLRVVDGVPRIVWGAAVAAV